MGEEDVVMGACLSLCSRSPLLVFFCMYGRQHSPIPPPFLCCDFAVVPQIGLRTYASNLAMKLV